MRITVSNLELQKLRADLAVCFAYEGDREPRGVADRELRHALRAEMKAEGFRGKPGDAVVWNGNGRYGARRFVVIGLGKLGERGAAEAIRQGAARAAGAADRFSATSLALRLPSPAADEASSEVRAAVEGAFLGAYHFERHLTDSARRVVRPRKLTVSVAGERRSLARAARLGEIGALAVCAARDLVNEAPSRMNPTALARYAAGEAKRSGLQCKVLREPQLRNLGMRALLAVARGSRQPGLVVHLTYRPRKRSAERIVLVGKGVTFDSGGLNLKPGDSMLHMKADMAGAAAVLATMTTLRELGCRVEVHALLGLVENMTGADAFKPGDILESFSGKTVEVGNTDAEGRLVLCDLLAYAAQRLKPTRVVDLATLTGACVVALGEGAAGAFTRDDRLALEFGVAGRDGGEKIWRLPLYDEYLDLLQRGPADLHTVGGRWGGAITAALFLGEFVPRDLPWLHLDIAGPAFTEKPLPEARVGGTGFGVRTLMRWLEAY